MADSFNEETMVEDAPANPPATSTGDAGTGDAEMAEAEGGGAEAVHSSSRELPFAEEGPEDVAAPRVSFTTYLMSPIVTLMLGRTEKETVLYAHQALLTRSPYFADACRDFTNDGSPRQVELINEDVDTVGCFLEFLYTGDYFPRKVPGQRSLEQDPSIPKVDETGEQLLKHAKVYTLAEKFQMPHLKNLASSKIHCVNSTAKGEIAYARYVYEFTSKDDITIRAPVANFWATRSHVLRAEAEEEFRGLCLEYPQFGYDVLTRVLDEKLKRERNDKMHPTSASARKRPRHSNA